MATHDLFPEIVGPLDSDATLIILVTSHGPSPPGGVAPDTLPSLGSLPLTAEIYQATPYLPFSYIGCLGASPHRSYPAGELFTQSDQTAQHVYMAVHASIGYSPLPQRLLITEFIVIRSPSPPRPTINPGHLRYTVTLWINTRPGLDLTRWRFSAPFGIIRPRTWTPVLFLQVSDFSLI